MFLTFMIRFSYEKYTEGNFKTDCELPETDTHCSLCCYCLDYRGAGIAQLHASDTLFSLQSEYDESKGSVYGGR